MITYYSARAEIRKHDLSIVDLRSPKEFALGSVPGAINLPLLDDRERHEVGLCYKSEGKCEAVALGLEYFSQKSEFFCASLREYSSSTGQVAIYCWRGGMRSQAVGKLCNALGIKPLIFEGGYKGFRRETLGYIDKLGSHPLRSMGIGLFLQAVDIARINFDRLNSSKRLSFFLTWKVSSSTFS